MLHPMNPSDVASLKDFKLLFKSYRSDKQFTLGELSDLTIARANFQQELHSDGTFSKKDSRNLVLISNFLMPGVFTRKAAFEAAYNELFNGWRQRNHYEVSGEVGPRGPAGEKGEGDKGDPGLLERMV